MKEAAVWCILLGADTCAKIFLKDGNTQLQYYACNKEMARQAKRAQIDRYIRADPMHPSGALQSTHGLTTVALAHQREATNDTK